MPELGVIKDTVCYDEACSKRFLDDKGLQAHFGIKHQAAQCPKGCVFICPFFPCRRECKYASSIIKHCQDWHGFASLNPEDFAKLVRDSIVK